MNYKEKYFKYKTKYLSLKKQFGGEPFHFSVYIFTREPLDEIRKNNMANLLKELYGDNTVVTDKTESFLDGFYWNTAVEYIQAKSTNKKAAYYKDLINVTSFVINNVPPQLLTSPMNDMKLTQEEHKINNELTQFSLDSLSMPIIDGGQDDPSFSRGWGFWSDGVAIITLVEK